VAVAGAGNTVADVWAQVARPGVLQVGVR
jgi:hypothetical protein